MTTPTAYERVYNFSNYQAQQPSDPLPGNQVDAELNAVKNSLDETQASLGLIQRADGQIANNSVGFDQLKDEVEIGVNPPTAWVTSHNYAVADTVTKEASFYRCLVAHVSGVFADDLAADYWELIADFSSAIGESVIEETLHAADSKAVPVDADEFMGNDSADSYTLRRFTWANIKATMFSSWGALINSGTGKTTPVDADALALMDSAAANATKKVTFANLKTALFAGLGATVAALTGKTTPVDADVFVIADSAASDASKKLTFANLKATIFAALGALIAAATGKTTPVDADSFLLSDSAASDASKKVTFANLKATLATKFFAIDTADQTITGGARVTSLDLGTPSAASTVTLDPGDRPMQHLTNNAAFTLAPGSNTGSIILDITNGASAGAITTSGFTKVVGAFTTTNGHKFRCSVSVGNAGSLLSIQPFQ